MSIPIITVTQMREWEQATWASGQTEEAVIRQAGAAVARLAEAVTASADSILILAGRGHNGDDARLAGEQMRDRRVELLTVQDPAGIREELVAQLGRHPDLIVDGLFGIGLNRALSAPWLELIRIVNESGRPVLAVDTPSGLNADTGVPMPDAIQAAWTLTLGAVKKGMVRSTAWPYVGRLEVAPEIGLKAVAFQTPSRWVEPSDFDAFPPKRPVQAHKGAFGHLLVVAGSLGYHGAAVLAARGAQRAQPGLTTVYTASNTYGPVAAQLQSAMVRPWPDDLALPAKCSAILMGPGMAASDVPRGVKESVRRLWETASVPVVADASALDWIPPGKVGSEAVRVLTPHPGEASRMLQCSVDQIQADREGAVRELSQSRGEAWVVLKGHQTVTGRGRGDVWVNSSGNPHLAQGGSGDLLAGHLAGWLAQAGRQADPGTAIRYAVWAHGAAADALTKRHRHWTVEDLAGVLGAVEPRPGRTWAGC